MCVFIYIYKIIHFFFIIAIDFIHLSLIKYPIQGIWDKP